MELVHEFVVSRPIDAAWAVLTDVERVAPCMPGAQLTEVDGEVYRGQVKVKVGPMMASFKGQARFTELDEKAHRAVLEARGKEATGKGQASALVTAELFPDGETTRVQVRTDLSISGRLAQFGQGALSEISTRLLGQFVDCLEQQVLGPSEEVEVEEAEEATARPVHAPAAVDLLQTVGPPLLKRLAPLLVGAVLLGLVVTLLRRLRA